MRIIVLLIFIVVFSHSSFGQVLYPNHYYKDYLKLLDLENEEFKSGIILHPSIITDYAPDSILKNDIWEGRFEFINLGDKAIQVLDPSWNVSYNSKYPRGYNDGAQWQGKGFNSVLNFGVTGKIGMLHYTFAPVVYMAQNSSYEIVTNSTARNEFAYPFSNNIDWVQRYGNNALYAFHPGQSEVRLVYKNATIGISTQNMVWGSSQFNPILMSTNAGGFPHVDLGTNVPVNTSIGDIEFKSYWGILKESAYFDSNDTNNSRYITGFVFGYSPKFIKGLSIGINKVLYQKGQDFDWKGIFKSYGSIFSHKSENLSGGGTSNDNIDHLASVVVRWIFEEVGFESYIEFARNDFSGQFVGGFFDQPDHSRAYTIGFIKTGKINGNPIKFTYEHTTLGKSRTELIRATPTYYVHGIVPQGYTNNGQVLGAGIGPGSNADIIEVKYYSPSGSIGFDFQRIRYNDDYYYSKFTADTDIHMDQEYNLGLNYLRFVDNLSFQIGFLYSLRDNWQYVKGSRPGNINMYFTLTRKINR
ncbi:capsule assembly Wzi family protein [Reichenbachiella sp. MALMAid0571]|uniref:capsule assembly Wzi family protein n=1 Tax=Reichenbachiella sp. MALMAid0571 TaxID=3143939 RepID=UPI0032DF96CC